MYTMYPIIQQIVTRMTEILSRERPGKFSLVPRDNPCLPSRSAPDNLFLLSVQEEGSRARLLHFVRFGGYQGIRPQDGCVSFFVGDLQLWGISLHGQRGANLFVIVIQEHKRTFYRCSHFAPEFAFCIEH